MPRVDGTDTLSRKALALLDEGCPLTDLGERLGLTPDQAKKLSRMRALHGAAAPHLTPSALAKLRALGLKALALSDLAREEDWPGLEEILQSVDPASVKRSELEKAPALLNEKRSRVSEAEAQTKARLSLLAQQQAQLQSEEIQLKTLEQEIDEQLSALAPYPEHVKEFLAEHLGIAPGGRLALAHRLDYPWQQSLKEKGTLRYDADSMVWLVEDLDTLAKASERRLKRGNPVRYDPDRVSENPFRRGPVAASSRYRMATGLAVDLRETRAKQRERLAEIRQVMKATEKEIRETRERSPQSFLEAVEAANQLSDRDLETHGRLQDAALRWLYDQGFVATTELTIGPRRWDVAGYDQDSRITIIEAKASVQDFRRDEKWREYLPYADRFYFIVEERFANLHGTLAHDVGWLAVNHVGQVRVVQECPGKQVAQGRESTRWAIARALAKRVVFGFRKC